MTTSLLQVVNIFKDNALKHKMVETASFGTLIQLLERPSVNYTDVFVLFNSSTINDNIINYNISLVVSGLIMSDDTNIVNLWSVNHKIGEDIIFYTNNTNRKDLEIDINTISGTPFFNSRPDKVAGVTFTFNVRVFDNQSGCLLPFND